MSKAKKELELIFIGVGALIFFAVIMFATIWITKPELIAQIYEIIRKIQTLGMWHFIPSGRDFMAFDNGDQSVWQIFKSSIPFGVISAIGIATITLIAYSKVSDEHLDNFITHPSPPDHVKIMEKFTHIKPAVRFILDYTGYDLSSSKGAGRLPTGPLEYLFEHNLIKRIGPESDWTNEALEHDFNSANPYPFLEVDEDRLRSLMAGTFGPANPFVEIYSLTDLEEIRAAIAKLPWYNVLVLAPALARIQRSIFYNEKAYVDDVMDLHGFPDKVWRDLNQLKAKEGERLRLGFDDDKHRASEESLYQEGTQKKKSRKKAKAKPAGKAKPPLVTLAEYLAEQITVKKGADQVLRGDTLPSVVEAREMLFDVLTTHLCEERKAYPVGEHEKTKQFIFVKTPPATAVEKTYFSKVQEQMGEASETLLAILQSNGYAFGLLGTAIERTRAMGIYHPTPWRWMRFIDLHLWRFVLDLGKPMPTVDSMGMWEHYKSEGQLHTPILEPFLRRAPNDLARQAARFVTQDVTEFFHKNMTLDDTAEHIAGGMFSGGWKEPANDASQDILSALGGIADDIAPNEPHAPQSDVEDAVLVEDDPTGPVKVKAPRRRRAGLER